MGPGVVEGLSSFDVWLIFAGSPALCADVGGSIDGRSVVEFTTGSGREANVSSPEEVSKVI